MTWIWIAFTALILGLLALDLGVFHRRPHAIRAGEALGWTAFWVALALCFNGVVYLMYEHHWLGAGESLGHAMEGREAALRFFTAYLVEKSLSLDNIFVIAMIFAFFRVPAEVQHRVLFWGVLGALVMRGAMIAGGLALVQRFTWLVYVFGGLLIATAVKMLVVRHDSLQPERSPLVRLVRRFFPVTDDFHGQRFFVTIDGRRAATPLALALAMVESTDLLFAVDSIPAVFSITLDPFIVYTSNVFAVLGLRSLYFALAALMGRFRYLKMSLVFLLAFIGVKMILTHHHPIPVVVSLAVIGGILTVGVLASVVAGGADPAPLESPLADRLEKLYRVTARTVWRVFILAAGSTLLLIGTVFLVLPGPGFLTLIVGLAILATEFVWARVWLARVRKKASELAEDARDKADDLRDDARGLVDDLREDARDLAEDAREFFSGRRPH